MKNNEDMESSDRIVFLLTYKFPFYPGEEFIETEIEYLCAKFEKVHVFPLNHFSEKDRKRKLPRNAEYHVMPKKHLLIQGLRILFDTQSLRWLFQNLITSFRYFPRGPLRLYRRLAVATYSRDFILKKLNEIDSSNVVIYSYWFDAPALTAALLKEKKGFNVVSRAHRGDLYAELRTPPYFPFQKDVIKKIDKLYVISQNGKNYIEKKYGKFENVEVSRLGVIKQEITNHVVEDGVFRLLSCSYVHSIKRVDIIANALRHISAPVIWTHIGDGPDLPYIVELSKTLPKHITCEFLGHMENTDVIGYYRNHHVDLFINVSSSEGVPVSIMEALSFGIPVFATAVGGTPEIVNDKNGKILPQNPTPELLAEELTVYINSPQEVKEQKRKEALNTWNTLCSAEVNYGRFTNQLMDMLRQKRN